MGGGLFATSNIWAEKSYLVARCYSATFRLCVETKCCSLLRANHDATINCSQVLHPKTGDETFNFLPQTNRRGAGLKPWEGSWAGAPSRLAPQLQKRSVHCSWLVCVHQRVKNGFNAEVKFTKWCECSQFFFVFRVLFLSSRWSQTPA